MPGTFTYNPDFGTVLKVGTHALNVTFTPTDAANYNTATAGVSINVTKAPLAITADAKSKTYGTTDPPLTWSATGALEDLRPIRWLPGGKPKAWSTS